MKNIVLTASLTTNLFIGTALYCFASGKVEHAPADWLTQAEPVKLSRR